MLSAQIALVRFRVPLAACTLLFVASLVGCGSGEPFAYVPANGSVTYDDNTVIPAPHIRLTFIAVNPPLAAVQPVVPQVGVLAPRVGWCPARIGECDRQRVRRGRAGRIGASDDQEFQPDGGAEHVQVLLVRQFLLLRRGAQGHRDAVAGRRQDSGPARTRDPYVEEQQVGSCRPVPHADGERLERASDLGGEGLRPEAGEGFVGPPGAARGHRADRPAGTELPRRRGGRRGHHEPGAGEGPVAQRRPLRAARSGPPGAMSATVHSAPSRSAR